MSREVRRVPASWEHPRDENDGHYIPMHYHFPYNREEIEEGLSDGWLDDNPPNYGCDVMPDWPESERTHYQMYETTTEGTPISPAMKTPEDLARWLSDNEASACGKMGATYDQWLAMINRGWAVSMVIAPGIGLISGVEEAARKV